MLLSLAEPRWCLQHLLELAEVREGLLQQLQCLEASKMHMAEQKLAEQTRLCNDLDVRLQAACATLDVSAGMINRQRLPQTVLMVGSCVHGIKGCTWDPQVSWLTCIGL